MNDPITIEVSSAGRVAYPIGDNIEGAKAFAEAAADAFSKIEAFKERRFISVCCRGSSGAVLAAFFIAKLGRGQMIYIRKDNETGHCNSYTDNSQVIIIIDDFVNSGATFREIWKKLSDDSSSYGKHRVKHIDCVIACYGYHIGTFTNPEKRFVDQEVIEPSYYIRKK